MGNQLKLKRGVRATIPTLGIGEPGWTTDTFELFIGDGGSNHRVGDGIFLALAGGTLTGALTLAAGPTNDMHAATKQYVDSVAEGLSVRAACRAATTASITLSGLQTIDGVVLAAGDRVLVKDQASASQNGIYAVASGAWSRATDADDSADVTSGMFTFVEEGTANSNAGYVLATANPITLGTTALTFSKFSSAGDTAAGAGLTKSGNTLAVGAGYGIEVDAASVTVLLDGGSLAKSSSGLKVAAGGITATELASGVAGTGLTGGGGTALSVVYGGGAGQALQGNATIDGGTW
jgi:hypothetical protein